MLQLRQYSQINNIFLKQDFPLWAPVPLNQQRVPVLAGVLDPDYQGETGLELHDGDKAEDAWDTGDLLLDLLVLTMPTDSGQWKSTPANPSSTSMAPTLQK